MFSSIKLSQIEESTVFTKELLESKNEKLSNNLKLALTAANQARKNIKISSTHPIANLLYRDDKFSLQCDEEEIRAICGDIIIRAKNKDPYILPATIWENVAKEIELHEMGRCGEFCFLVMHYLYKQNVQIPIEIFNIEKGDHCIIVIDRDPKSREDDYKSWGENAVVCDAWAGKVYPANQIGNLLETHYVNKQGKNELLPFNQKYHRLYCKYSLGAETEKTITKIINNYRASIIAYLDNELLKENITENRKKQFELCLNTVRNEIDRDKIKSALALLKQELLKHEDTGCKGFFKATWARNPASYNRFTKAFDNESELKKYCRRA